MIKPPTYDRGIKSPDALIEPLSGTSGMTSPFNKSFRIFNSYSVQAEFPRKIVLILNTIKPRTTSS